MLFIPQAPRAFLPLAAARVRESSTRGERRKGLGRDHHVDAFTMWLAGGGVKPGLILWRDRRDLGFSVVENKVHVHDVHATILHLLGFDHTKLTFRF